MRILHFVPSLNVSVGGPARAVPDLCRCLASAGHTVTLTAADLGNVATDWQRRPIDGLTLLQAPKASLPAFGYTPRDLHFFNKLLAEHDALHVHGVWEYANIQLSKLATRARKPYVVSVRGMLGLWPLRQRWLKKQIYLKLAGSRWLSNAAALHFTAQSELDAASKWVSVRRGVVLPNLLDLEQYRSLPPAADAYSAIKLPPGDNPRVLFLGRIHPVKGLDTLLRSIALLKNTDTPVSLIVAGDGDPTYVAEMRGLAQELGISSDVLFAGMITGPLKVSLLQACDLLAVPSHHENFGFVFVEALACGLPVVTTREVGIWADLEASGAAIIAERSPQSFASAITGALQKWNKETREQGRRWVFDWLSAKKLIPQFTALYARTPSHAE